MDYRKTLNNPQTELPHEWPGYAADKRTIQRWYLEDIYGKLIDARQSAVRFQLLDFPVFASRHITTHDVIDKILKDVVVRFKAMEGYRTPFIPSWNCHGPQIALQVLREVGPAVETMTPAEFRAECEAYAERYVSNMQEELRILGCLGEWERPNLTMSRAYESRVVAEFQQLVLQDYIYFQTKPVDWCVSCGTAVDIGECAVHRISSNMYWIKFELLGGIKRIAPDESRENMFLLAPLSEIWQIPGLTGLAIAPENQYLAVKNRKQIFIITETEFSAATEMFHWDFPRIVGRFKGIELAQSTCRNFWDNAQIPVLPHGDLQKEDVQGIEAVADGYFATGSNGNCRDQWGNTVLDNGRFAEGLAVVGGMQFQEGRKRIEKKLQNASSVVAVQSVEQEVRACRWCGNRLIQRNVPQWYFALDRNALRSRTLEALKKIKGLNSRSGNLIETIIATRPDWCISRQGIWGIPITAYRCAGCGEILRNEIVGSRILKQVRLNGAAAWFDPSRQFIPEGLACDRCGSSTFNKTMYLLDSGFESGVFSSAGPKADPHLNSSETVVLESERRAYTLAAGILIRMANHSSPSCKRIVIYPNPCFQDIEVDFPAPGELIQQYGIDVIRIWSTLALTAKSIRMARIMLEKIGEMTQDLRAVFRFMAGVISDFQPDAHLLPYSEISEFDQFQLAVWSDRMSQIQIACSEYDFYHAIQMLYGYCMRNLSEEFLEISKDTLYADPVTSPLRRSCRSVIYLILRDIIHVIAPVMTVLSEELRDCLMRVPGSVHQEVFRRTDYSSLLSEYDWEKWNRLMELRKLGVRALETARQEGKIENSLGSRLIVYASPDLEAFFKSFSPELLARIMITSEVSIQPISGKACDFNTDILFSVERAVGVSCLRCRRFVTQIPASTTHPELCPRCLKAVQEK